MAGCGRQYYEISASQHGFSDEAERYSVGIVGRVVWTIEPIILVWLVSSEFSMTTRCSAMAVNGIRVHEANASIAGTPAPLVI